MHAPDPDTAPAQARLADENPAATLTELLLRCARLAAAHGVSLDAFMSAAFESYVDARPGLRHELEERHTRAWLAELRDAGKIGQA